MKLLVVPCAWLGKVNQSVICWPLTSSTQFPSSYSSFWVTSPMVEWMASVGGAELTCTGIGGDVSSPT